MNKDEAYEDMVRTERRAKRIFKQNNFRSQSVPDGCHNCKHMTIYDPYEYLDIGCNLADTDPSWSVAKVSNFDICDKFEKVES